MRVQLIGLGLVAADEPHREPYLERMIENEVQGFFLDHINALRSMSEKPDAPPHARFIDLEAQAIFHTLHSGDEDQFATSAGALTKRLVERMNGRTPKGLLACVRADGEAGRVSAVMKLQIDSSRGTRLEQLASGEVRLSAVTNLVREQPGKLQKGILLASDMPAEEVVCGDTLEHQSRYFPEAFGIQVFAKPRQGLAGLMQAVAEYNPELVPDVVRTLPQVSSGSARSVLAELGEHVTDLDTDAQTRILGSLTEASRPIAQIDTARGVDAKIEFDGLIIKGPADIFHSKVLIRPTPDGTHEIVIAVDGRPEITYRPGRSNPGPRRTDNPHSNLTNN